MVTLENGYKISIMLTEKCNLKCSHCYMSANYKGKSLSKKQISTIINNLPNNIKRISITGGEPYMERDNLYFMLEQINNKFKDADLEIRLETNGTFFYQSEESILKEVNNLIEKNVKTLRMSDDSFHVDGGLNLNNFYNIEKVIKKHNLKIDVSILKQGKVLSWGRAETLDKKYIEPKNCLNRKDSLSCPYFYLTLDGDVSTCAWKCAPSLGNVFVDSWDRIVENLNSPLQMAILNSDIKTVIKLVSKNGTEEKQFLKYLKYGQCAVCKKMFKGTYNE